MERDELPSVPHSVVFSGGHSFVLEETDAGHLRWVGVDDRGRPAYLTDADLRRRGWSYSES
jgi:hypothetical protein